MRIRADESMGEAYKRIREQRARSAAKFKKCVTPAHSAKPSRPELRLIGTVLCAGNKSLRRKAALPSCSEAYWGCARAVPSCLGSSS